MEPEIDISNEEQIEIQNAEGIDTPKVATTRKKETPCGSLYYAPIVDESLLPVVGKNYGTLEECEKMYRLYAFHACFDIRKSTQKTTKSGLVKQKYYLCNRGGVPMQVNFDTLQSSKKPIRKSNMECTGCRARVKFDWVYGTNTFILSDFQEHHNHELLPQEYRHLSKAERQMKYAEQLFVYHSSVSNIGPTKAYEVYSNMKGSEKNVHGTVTDFRNWRRDLNVFINASDSQMLVNKMEERKKYVPGFSFEYKLEKSQLHSIFWADEVAKCDYKEFSDIISFDATYRTDMYNMKFVPFTGIDNHHRCVTVAARLIRDETAESYTWLLTCFMKTFGKEPNMIVIDQDKSMAIAIKAIFKTIQEAIPTIEDEVEKDFKNRLNKLVWNMYIEPNIFKERWEKLMQDFSLKNDSWFKHMFDIRSTWIPAYFIDTEMFGLMRTTSRSESENDFFSNFTRSAANLLTFMDGFESAMLKQRSKQESLDAQTIKKNPKLLTQLKIEKHALKVYTHAIFAIVQKEIYEALYSCLLDKMDKEEETEIYVVKEEKEKTKEGSNEEKQFFHYKPLILEPEKNIYMYFITAKTDQWYVHVDTIYDMVFCVDTVFGVLKNKNIEEIPEKYIMGRWRRDIIPPELRSRRNRYGNENIVVQDSVNEITSVVYDCVGLVGSDEKMLKVVLEKLKLLKKEVEAQVPKPSKNKDDIIGNMIGVSKPSIIEIQNPPVGNYKGCANDKRLMSGKEKAIKESKKRKFTCGKCGCDDHNQRTCDKKKKAKEQAETSEI
ncbi:protein FAR1-RELATED SEQUENCE 5-like [Rutidosis leptorrhynchoides]|uniref:protein FAR1-RELATED SEQUENCE 5-like n=1 Tax=Rutidosis leptorrhynchoides TaxID=125765 RepID=UPI003A99BF47